MTGHNDPSGRKQSAGFMPAALLSFLWIALLVQPLWAQEREDLNVLDDWLLYSDIENSLYHHLAGQALERLEQRRQSTVTLRTAGEWESYREAIQQILTNIVGPFPERTSLNPQVTGILEREDFRVENIVYESQPEFYVTAALFIPKELDEPAPAIIYASGHTANGFRAGAYQHKIINLVKKGFVVLAFDPLGQGERLQYVDEETGGSTIGGPTNEHSYAGAQAFLTTSSLARYMIWDGIRAVDLLLNRDEVDPDRIGITGRSGGGTQASYIAAMDDRIYASAPENYITSFEYLLSSIGPQDAEQNFYHGIASGIDHADLLLARAPKPNLLIATSRDFFSIQGAHEAFREVSRAYEILGYPDQLEYAEDDHGHGSTRANREAMYTFFQQHLALPGSADDLDVELFDEEELYVTETGQVSTSLGGETVFSLHAPEAAELSRRLRETRSSIGESQSELDRGKLKVMELSGFRPPVDERRMMLTGRYNRQGYDIEQYFIRGEGDYPIPFLLFRPEEPDGRIVIYLDPQGKAAEAGQEGDINRLVKSGAMVVAPDLPGIGELGPGNLRGDSHIGEVSYNQLFAAVLIGRSITGLRAGEITRLLRTVMAHEFPESIRRTDMDRQSNTAGNSSGVQGDGTTHAPQVTLMAKGNLTPAALHAALFSEAVTETVLVNPLISYEALATNRHYKPEWVHSIVAGALTEYDLPDLAAMKAPKRLLILNMVDEMSRSIPGDSDRIEQVYGPVKEVYEREGVPGHFGILTAEEDERMNLIMEWLEGYMLTQ